MNRRAGNGEAVRARWTRGRGLVFATLAAFGCVLSFSASAAEPGLPFTEDFTDTNLRDPARTTAGWSTREQALVLASRKRLVAAFDTSNTAGVDIGSDFGLIYDLDVGDVDGDGDNDVVVGGLHEIRLYLNNGTAAPFDGVDGTVVAAVAGSHDAVALGDVDGDGDLDLVVGRAEHENALYLNNGTPDPFGGVVGSAITADVHITVDVTLGDVDGDGDLDLVAGNCCGAANRLYRNNGTATPFDSVVGSNITEDVDDTRAVVLGDLDADGDLDLVVGNLSAPNRLYPNVGGVFAAGSEISSDADPSGSIALGDVDGDGDVDVVVANGQFSGAPTRLYLNNGTATPFAGVSGSDVSSDIEFTNTAQLGDVDGDGDLDVVATRRVGGPSRLYLNDGSSTPFAGVVGSDITSDGDNSDAAGLADMDGDGDLDLVVGNSGTPKRLYLNNGADDPFATVAGATLDMGNTSFVVGDVDRDGDLDVVSNNGILLNNGTSDPFDGVTSVPFAAEPLGALAMGDVDGDGDLDLAVAGFGSPNLLYLNDGTADPFDATSGIEITIDAHDTVDITLGDVNGDGTLDLVAGNRAQPNRVYLNNGTAAPFDGIAGSDITADADLTLAVALGDFDGDGDLDFVAANGASASRLYFNDGTGSFTAGNDVISAQSLAVGDVDGDGDLDLIAGREQDPNRLLLNNGTSVPFDVFGGVPIGTDPHDSQVLLLGDLDRDGDLDLVAANGGLGGQRNRLYLNNGTGAPFAGVIGTDITLDAGVTLFAALGDMDADGDLDVVAPGGFGPALYLNNGTPAGFGAAAGANVGAQADATLALAAADLDRDGDVDLVAGNDAQPNRFHLNNGNGTFAAGADVAAEADGTLAVAVGDVDGDGDPDLLAGNDGVNRLYENDTDPILGFQGFLAAVDVDADDLDTTASLALADVDRDGDLDVVAGNDGINRIYLGNGDTTFAAGADAGADNDDTRAVALGDVDRDGAPDLVAGNDGINRLYLGNGDGTFAAGANVSLDADTTLAVALGDVDRDGDVDLIAGNDGINRLYLNDTDSVLGFQGFLAGVDVAASDADATASIRLVDVDRDGWLDLVVGNDGTANRVYLNNRSADPFSGVDGVEVTADADATRAIALADVDRDGVIDVLVGNDGQANRLYSPRIFDTSRTIATSLEVDTVIDVHGATIASDVDLPPNTSVALYLSNDGGARWVRVDPGVEFVFPSLGDDLRWRAELRSLSPVLSPRIESLVLTARTDGDGDGVTDDVDVCPADPDPGQEDFDGDGLPGGSADPNVGGDVCDADDDDDGAPDATDADPFDGGVQNVAPVISGSPPTSATPGVAIDFTPEVLDSGYEIHVFELAYTGGVAAGLPLPGGDHTTLPAWLSFDPATGRLSGTASNDDYGTVNGISITATDRSDVQSPLSDSLAPFDLSALDTRAPVTVVVPPAGTYPGAQSVTLTCVEAIGSGCAATYYTLDGSDPVLADGVIPSAGAVAYSSPFVLAASGTIAVASIDAALDAGGSVAPNGEPVQTIAYTVDGATPQVSIAAPTDGSLLSDLDAVTGASSDVGTGVQTVEVSIGDATNSVADVGGGVLALVPGPPVFLPAIDTGGGDYSTWTLDTTTVNWTDGTYTVTARAVDGAGSAALSVHAVEIFTGAAAATTLTLDLTAPSIVFGGEVDATVKLTKTGFPSADLSGSEVMVRVFDPDDVEVATLPVVTNSAGQATLDDLGSAGTGVTFDAEGAWRLEAEFAGTLKLATAFGESGLLVGTSAGYAVIVQGKHPSGEGQASHDKTAKRIYETFRRRGFEEQNIFYFNFDTSQDANGDGVPDDALGQESVGVDAVPSRAIVQSTIESLWQLANANPAPIYTVMIDHGGDERFFLGNETIVPADLDAWLDTLESGLSVEAASKARVVIAGACYSGGFIPALAAPNRLLITSSAANEESYKGPLERDGVRVGEYFLEELFKELETGRDFLESFEAATEKTETFTRRGGALSANAASNVFRDSAVQHPLLHDDGDPLSSPVNALKADSSHGSLAGSLVLGLVPPSSTNVVELVAAIDSVTPTRYLPHDDASVTLELEANFVSEVRQAFVEIRGPGVELAAGNGTVQLERAIGDPEAMTPPVDPDPRFLLGFTDETSPFGVPGKYEIFYYVEDVDADDPASPDSRRLSPAKRSVAYRGLVSNAAPSGFALEFPADASTQKTVLGFDWADSSDVDGVSYTLRIALDTGGGPVLDGDGVLADSVHLREELTGSSAFVGLGVLEDQKSYFWQVEAIDGYGARTPSAIRSFATDNQNVIPGVIRGVILSDQTAVGIATASVTTQEIGGGARTVPCAVQDECLVVEVDGQYFIITLPGTFEVVASDDDVVPKFVTQMKSVTLPEAQIQSDGTVVGGEAVLDFALAPDPLQGQADLSVSVTDSPDPVDVSSYGYVVTVSNVDTDLDDASDVTLTVLLPGTGVLLDATPEQGECALAVTTLTCSLGAIAPGSSVEVDLTLAPALAGGVSATFSVAAPESDPNPANNEVAEATTVNQVFDADVDGVVDAADNCPSDANADQADADGDGAGDVCDAFPGDPGEQADSDGDGTGDNSDAFPDNPAGQTDVDADGLGDEWEVLFFGDLTPQAGDDPDGDGQSNVEEFGAGTDPTMGAVVFEDDLVIDFGQAGVKKGIWIRKNDVGLTFVHPSSAQHMVLADVDGNGQTDVVADFGQAASPKGIWIRLNDGAWVFRHPSSAQRMLVGDVDGNGSDDVLVDFGTGGGTTGLWVYLNGSQWVFVLSKSPQRWLVADVDGNGADDVLFDFGQSGGSPTGLWIRKNGTSWSFLYPKSAVAMLAADMDGSGGGDVVIDFGGGAPPTGTWIRKNDAVWQFQHPKSPLAMWAADCDGSGSDDVLFDFGQSGGAPTGLWWRMNDSAWQFQHPSSLAGVLAADADGNGSDDVLLDFGQAANPKGLWWRKNCATWFFQHAQSAVLLGAGDVDESGHEDALMDFGQSGGSQGLWARKNDATWSFIDAQSPVGVLVGNVDGQ